MGLSIVVMLAIPLFKERLLNEPEPVKAPEPRGSLHPKAV
jgi:hypothetical protein